MSGLPFYSFSEGQLSVKTHFGLSKDTKEEEKKEAKRTTQTRKN